jgi:hypothetical protein
MSRVTFKCTKLQMLYFASDTQYLRLTYNNYQMHYTPVNAEHFTDHYSQDYIQKL